MYMSTRYMHAMTNSSNNNTMTYPSTDNIPINRKLFGRVYNIVHNAYYSMRDNYFFNENTTIKDTVAGESVSMTGFFVKHCMSYVYIRTYRYTIY